MADSDRAPMTIKAVPIETRETMLRLAKARGQTIAEWLTQAVAQMATIQAGDRVDPAKFDPPTAVAPAAPPPSDMTLRDLAEAMQAAAAVAAASGRPLPKATAGHAYALLGNRLRDARGLPPVKPRQTRPQIGQTIVDD